MTIARPGRFVFPAQPAAEREYRLRHGWRTARLRADSAHLLNYNATPLGDPYSVGEPSVRQLFPTTAAGLIAALGATGVILPANVLAIYACDTASPLVDSLGLGPNLVAAGGPLTGRECVGLPDTTFASKVGVEFSNAIAPDRFQDAGAAFADVVGGARLSILCVFRTGTNAYIRSLFAKRAANGYYQEIGTWAGGQFWQYLTTPAGTVAAIVNGNFVDGAWHNCVSVFDDTAKTVALLTDLGDNGPIAYLNSGSNAIGFCLGGSEGGFPSGPSQVAYLAVLDVALTSAQRATFWRHAQSAGLGTPNVYTRANPLVVPISASRVSCLGAGQLAVGYDAGLNVPALGNTGTGVVAEDGATFEPIGSDDFYTNATVGWPGSAKTSVDGASAMRDGVRATNAAAWNPAAGQVALFGPAAGTVIAGASNVPWRADVDYRRATVNTTARMALMFQNDPGGTEWFTLIADGATPVDWVRGGGTCTPVGAAHTRVYWEIGGNAVGDDCDFSELALIKNRATASLAWRRVGTAAAAATSTSTLSLTNANNARYNPPRGSLDLIISGFQGTNGATFLQFGAAGAAGSLTLDYSAGQLRLRMWDAAGVLALTVNGGALTSARHKLTVGWESLLGASLIEGSTVLGTWAGAWTPAPGAVTPLYVGTDAAGANAARCVVELVAWRSK